MICKLCRQKRPLVKAHVIPEAFIRRLRTAESSTLYMASNRPGAFPQRAPVGPYDRNLLCRACEDRFGPGDAYGAEVLLNRFDELFRPRHHRGERFGYTSDRVDQSRLWHFLVGVLWRAAASGEPFFEGVRLDIYQELARRIVLGDPGPTQASIVALLVRWHAAPERAFLTPIVHQPRCGPWHGVDAVRLSFGDISAVLKVDPRPLPATIEKWRLGADATCRIVVQDLEGSPELGYLDRALGNTPRKMLDRLAAKYGPAP